MSNMSINDPNYVTEFKIADAVVGQIGYGFIGNAVVELFRPFAKAVYVYDKAGYEGRTRYDNVVLCESADEVVSRANVIFTAVPTPMKKTGECDTSIIESVIQNVQNTALKLARNLEEFILVIKSTVPPGFTKRMQDKYALRLMFSPEFLTEANAVQDFKKANRVLLGGELEDARVVFKYFEGVWPGRVMGPAFDPQHPDGPVAIVQCDSSVAEMVKLSTNVHLTAKVMISNELYLICEKLGIQYEEVKVLTQFDRRIGTSHMNVPGPDGHLGYGGHCFVKDTQSLGFISEQLGASQPRECGAAGCSPGVTSLFRDLHERNLQIREDRDWEAQRGRAVSDE